MLFTVIVADMVAVPAESPLTTPSVTEATAVSSDFHVISALLGTVVAVSVADPDTVISFVSSLRVTDGSATVAVYVAVSSPAVAVTVAVPAPSAVTVPSDTLSTLLLDVAQLTAVPAGRTVTSSSILSPTSKLPVVGLIIKTVVPSHCQE